MNSINLNLFDEAAKKINKYIHETPVMESSIINSLLSRNVYFKCEHLQKTGSFKIRGAINNVLCKIGKHHLNGIITHSSGNHGQAVAFAGKLLNIPVIVVVPISTSNIKCEAIKFYGAQLKFSEDTPQSREEMCNKLANEYGYVIIHPYDDYDTIYGQGTVAIEFLKQVPHLDAVIISVSGGGLSAGCAAAFKKKNSNIKVYCVEPDGKELERSLRSSSRLWTGQQKCLNTIAEGIRIQQPGNLTFPILCDFVEKEVLTVSDNEMIEGMKISMKYLKQVIEAAAGASVQALFKYNDVIPKHYRNIGIVLCGGNLDVDSLFQS